MNSPSFFSQIRIVLLISGTYFFNYVARIVLSPLMPSIEKDLNIGHDEAGAFFFMISLGYCIGLLISGFISSRLNHRRTIILSSITVGGALLLISIMHHLSGIRLGLVLLGVTAGFYLPSGVAILTELVSQKDWGKTFGIFEIAPNLAFVLTPFLIEALVIRFSWQEVLRWIGITSIIAGIFFAILVKGVEFRGEAPNSKMIKSIAVNPSLWIMIVLFTLGLGASFGVYSMIPLYLVSERGMERQWANTFLGLSRISALGMNLLAGWMTDHLGLKTTIKTVFFITGLITILLGIVPGNWVVLIVFLQPMIATCFFTPGFAALSRIVPPSLKNVVVSLTIPISFLIGGGVIPAGIGIMGEMGSFSLGISLLGVLLFGGVILARYLKFYKD